MSADVRAQRRTDEARADHYLRRYRAAQQAGDTRAVLNEAVDYLRAALAREPVEVVGAVAEHLVEVAGRKGRL